MVPQMMATVATKIKYQWVIAAGLVLAFVYFIKKWFTKTEAEQLSDAASGELQKRIKSGKVVTLSDYQAQDIAGRFNALFKWDVSFDQREFERLVNQMRTYGDILKVEAVYGERPVGMFGSNEGGLSYHINQSGKTMAIIYYNTYKDRAKLNNK